MRTTEVTITIRGPEVDERLLQALEDFMWNYPVEFEDWLIRTRGIPEMYDMTNWMDGTKAKARA